MKHLSLPLAACLALSSVAAPAAAEDSGESLMERGAQLFWEGLRQEMAPALEDLRRLTEEFGPSLHQFLSEMGPALAAIADEVEDWSAYEAPEILPNGDIIIRRKPQKQEEAPEPGNPGPPPEGAIDL